MPIIELPRKERAGTQLTIESLSTQDLCLFPPLREPTDKCYPTRQSASVYATNQAYWYSPAELPLQKRSRGLDSNQRQSM